MKSFVFTILCLASCFIQAQNNAIGSNEKLVFTASYNMSGLLTDLAQVTMETSEVNTSKSTLLHLKGKARTFTKWDTFFKINDLYESYVHPNSLKPYLYKRDINEGGYYKFMQYNYNHSTNTVKSLKRKRRGDGTYWDENKNLNISSNAKDIIATLYHIRNLDIHKASIGNSDTFSVLMDNEEFTITLTLLAKETINTNIGRKECYKLAIAMNNNILKGNNDNLLWLTADANKVPVYAKFKVPVGNGELRIQSATGLKN